MFYPDTKTCVERTHAVFKEFPALEEQFLKAKAYWESPAEYENCDDAWMLKHCSGGLSNHVPEILQAIVNHQIIEAADSGSVISKAQEQWKREADDIKHGFKIYMTSMRQGQLIPRTLSANEEDIKDIRRKVEPVARHIRDAMSKGTRLRLRDDAEGVNMLFETVLVPVVDALNCELKALRLPVTDPVYAHKRPDLDQLALEMDLKCNLKTDASPILYGIGISGGAKAGAMIGGKIGGVAAGPVGIILGMTVGFFTACVIGVTKEEKIKETAFEAHIKTTATELYNESYRVLDRYIQDTGAALNGYIKPLQERINDVADACSAVLRGYGINEEDIRALSERADDINREIETLVRDIETCLATHTYATTNGVPTDAEGATYD